MEGGLFTTALQIFRAAWSLVKRLFTFFTSLGGGLVSELVALAIIWFIVIFGERIIEKLILFSLWLLKVFR